MAFFNQQPNQETNKRDPAWADFFGPRGLPEVTNPYSGYPRETLALPDVYKGSNPYLTNIMLTIISEEELVPTRILLPLRVTGDETSITWDEFYFNNTLLGAVPEEGVSRLVTQQISERRDHYVRYGLAFMIEHGFMKSPKGQMTYNANLMQIRDAILQSLYIGVIEALLRCKTNSQFFQQNYGNSLTALSARKRLEMEVEAFGEIQKTPHGWEMLNSRAQRTLRLSSIEADAWVVDDGVKMYIASRPESWAYYLHGERGENLRLENQGVGNAKSLDIASKCLIFETKQFNLPTHDDPVNITSRKRAIGEYMLSFPHIDYDSCGKYTSAMRDIMIYDEDRDGFTKLSLAEGLKHCQRFHRDDGSLDHHNFRPEGFIGSDGKGQKGHGRDIFFTKQHPTGVEYFGQMREEDMPEEAVQHWTSSVINQFDARSKTELIENLEALHSLVRTLDGTDTIDIIATPNREWLRAVAEDHLADPRNVKQGFDTVTGMMKITKSFVEFAGTEMIPYGYGSYAGICEIATSGLSMAGQAIKAKKAVDTIKSKLDQVCFGNAFTQETSVPAYIKHKTTAAGIFFNLIHQRYPPVVVTSVENPDPQAPDLDRKTNYSDKLHEVMNLNQARFGEGGIENTPGTEVYNKAKVLTDRIVHTLMGMFSLLTEKYAKILITMLGNILNYSEMEGLFTAFMKDSSDHDWYTLTKSIDACKDPDGVYQIAELAKNLMKHKGKNPQIKDQAPQGRKTRITQLTCSPQLREALQLHNEYLIKLSRDTENKTRLQTKWTEKIPADTRTEEAFKAENRAAVQREVAAESLYGLGIFSTVESYMDLATTHDPETQRPTSLAFGAGGEFGDEETITQGVGGRSGGIKRAGLLGVKRRVPEEYNTTEEMMRFTGWWADDVEMSDAMRRIESQTSGLDRVFSLAFYGNAVNEKMLARCIKTNCVFPFNMLYARPFQTYSMSTGVCMKAGASTGETLVGHADFQLGDNVVQKLHLGNFTFYSRSVVYKERQVFLAPNMFATAYNGGAGSLMFEGTSDYDNYMENGNRNMRQKSIFAILDVYGSKSYPNPIDITGRHSGNLYPLDPTQDAMGNLEPHYSTAHFYRKLWGWSETQEDSPVRCSFDNDDDGSPNTVCFQGHQTLYNPGAGGLFDIIMPNTGHWGPNVYPGVGKVRNGHGKVVIEQNFSNLYGGGANLNGMGK